MEAERRHREEMSKQSQAQMQQMQQFMMSQQQESSRLQGEFVRALESKNNLVLQVERREREMQETVRQHQEQTSRLQEEYKAEVQALKAQGLETSAQLQETERLLKDLNEREAARELEIELLKNYPPQPFQQSEFFKKGINIAFTGPSRAGKSTLINTLRDLRSRDHGAAPVKHGVEGTLKPTPYRSNIGGIDVTFWDLPGHGTGNFPLETYLRDMGLRYFNLVNMVTKDVFSEGDLKLMNEMLEHNVQHVMIRNKIDETLRAAEMEGDDLDLVCEAIRDDFRQQGIEQVFFTSAPLSQKEKHDMPEYLNHLLGKLDDLREDLTREGVTPTTS